MFKNHTSHFCGVLILILLVTCCHSKKNNTTNPDGYPITIDFKEAIRNQVDYKHSDIYDSITYIAVESIIGDYVTSLSETMLKITRNFIFAESHLGSGEVVFYDRNGKFLRKISQRGRGPGEYAQLSDIAADEDNSIIYVLSGSERKVFKYSFEGVF